MSDILSPDDRDKLRREMNDALDACLAENPRMVGYLLINITQANKPGKASAFMGTSSAAEVMSILLAQILQIGKDLGVPIPLTMAALDFGADILDEDKEARQ